MLARSNSPISGTGADAVETSGLSLNRDSPINAGNQDAFVGGRLGAA